MDEGGFRPDAWRGAAQHPSTYLTTTQLAKRLAKWAHNDVHLMEDTKRNISYSTVSRWCSRDWFGPLPEWRTGKNMGYRIPPEYEFIGRVWLMTADLEIRKAALDAMVGQDPRPYLVVVAKTGSLHYSEADALHRISTGLPAVKEFASPAHVLYIGPVPTP